MRYIGFQEIYVFRNYEIKTKFEGLGFWGFGVLGFFAEEF